MAKKALTPNLLAATNTRFKNRTNDSTAETQANTSSTDTTNKDNTKQATNEESTEPTHEMNRGEVVEIQKRTVGKAGRPRARQYNNKGTRPTTFNMPIDMKEQVESCAFFSKVEQADIIRTALKLFLEKHATANSLKTDGERLVRDYIKETSIK